MDYSGYFVFLENADGKSTYNNGEFFILRSTPNMLYGIKPTTGHDTREYTFPVCKDARQRYRVIDAYVDWDAAKSLYRRLLAFSNERLHPSWVPSVYDAALNSARSIGRILEKANVLHCSVESHVCQEQEAADLAALVAKTTDLSCKIIRLEKWADKLVAAWPRLPTVKSC